MERFIVVVSDDINFTEEILKGLRGNDAFAHLGLEVRTYLPTQALPNIDSGDGWVLQNPFCRGLVSLDWSPHEEALNTLRGIFITNVNMVWLNYHSEALSVPSGYDVAHILLGNLYQRRIENILSSVRGGVSSGEYQQESVTNLLGTLTATVRAGWGVLSNEFQIYLREYLDVDDIDSSNVRVYCR